MDGDNGEMASRFPAGLSAAEFALVARLPIFTGLDEARIRRACQVDEDPPELC